MNTNWLAVTSNGISVGARLHVMTKPQVVGQTYSSLPSGVDIAIQAVNTHLYDARTGSWQGNQLELHTPDGHVWLISPVEPGEVGSSFRTNGMVTEDWIVREQIA